MYSLHWVEKWFESCSKGDTLLCINIQYNTIQERVEVDSYTPDAMYIFLLKVVTGLLSMGPNPSGMVKNLSDKRSPMGLSLLVRRI